MSAQVLSFLRRPVAPRDWSAQELAEFYRVESALIQAGLRVTTARGLTDEDEPWFVFCRAGDDEVIIHFARIDGHYVISAPGYCANASGPDFRALVQRVVERQPVLQPRPNGNNLFLHPAALLVMLVASALLKSGHAAEATPAAVAEATEGKSRGVAPAPTPAETVPEAQHETLILAAITAAIAPLVETEPVTIIVSASAHLPVFVDLPPEQSISPVVPDLPRDGAEQGAGSVTSAAPLLHSIATPPSAEATPSALVHLVHQPEAGSGVLSVAATQTALVSGVLPIETGLNALPVAPDPAIGAQHLSLSTLSGIPHAELDLLHALRVSGDVAYTATLPVALATVLQTGAHSSVSESSVSESSVSQSSVANANTALPAAEHASPADSASGPSPTVAPVPPTTGPAAQHAAPAPVPDMSAVLATVEQFQAVAVHPVVVLTDHAAIFYDAAAVDSNLSAVKSVNYDFAGGFSISLVGLPAELAHAGVHV